MNLKKWLMLFIVSAATAACARLPAVKDRGTYFADESHPSQSQNERIRFLILHYTAEDDAESLRLLTQGNVSAHYLIPIKPSLLGRKPVILQLVKEDKRAWHAGISAWHGRTNLNDNSIGVEIVNKGFLEDKNGQKLWFPFNDDQIAAVAALARDIIDRYHIQAEDVLGHSDVSPLRKFDPGPLFPWGKLAELGIGAWPDAATVNRYLAERPPSAWVDVRSLQAALLNYGYTDMPQTGVLDDATRRVISAFQMHFRPSDISGAPDAETYALVQALLEKYRKT
ncbi:MULTISPECIES: N-acetylmuramoyl-L-alanine amidase [unclassified Luteibacter]|uniref:N-acetylmuramoyl-L-alanine amidase n=1 Tax=Luteibacter sp. PvP019 TaxID=3156436 RepID=UPI003398BBA9